MVRGNVLWGNNANGIHMNGDIFSRGGDGIISAHWSRTTSIYDNGRGGGSGINCDGVQNSLIRNNLIYNNHASGISLYRIDGGGGSTGNVVVNNTVLVAADGRWALNISNGSTGNTVLNNILYNDHSFRGSITVSADSLSGFTSDYNVVMDRFTTDGGEHADRRWRSGGRPPGRTHTRSSPRRPICSWIRQSTTISSRQGARRSTLARCSPRRTATWRGRRDQAAAAWILALTSGWRRGPRQA